MAEMIYGVTLAVFAGILLVSGQALAGMAGAGSAAIFIGSRIFKEVK